MGNAQNGQHIDHDQLWHLAVVAGMVLGPALYGSGEAIHHQAGVLPTLGASLACLGLYLWVAGILGMVQLVRQRFGLLGIAGGAAAILGLIAVSNIMLLQLVMILIERKAENYPQVIDGVFSNVLFVTYIFGPAFPTGLFLLGLGLHRLARIPKWITLSYILGTLMFPLGRFGGQPLLIHLSDSILAVASAVAGIWIWVHPNLWLQAEERSE